MALPRPGDVTVPFRGGPIGMWKNIPFEAGGGAWWQADDHLDEQDGLLFCIASRDDWRYMLASATMKLGWVLADDLGVTCVGFVYSMKERSTIR